ncbi:MAG: hypothetical protein M1357_01050 [Candidatus Marsarchaeota archaeon]|nr:hypothetical protein [Candidatus Marsarchaeota archaeon]
MIYTTSRSPSPRSRSLAAVMSGLTPNGVKVSRGKTSLAALRQIGVSQGAAIILVYERHGNPAGFSVWDSVVGEKRIGFDGVTLEKTTRRLVDSSDIGKINVPSKRASTNMAEQMRLFLEGLPASAGRGQAQVLIEEKDNRETVSVELKGVKCVSFHFRR